MTAPEASPESAQSRRPPTGRGRPGPKGPRECLETLVATDLGPVSARYHAPNGQRVYLITLFGVGTDGREVKLTFDEVIAIMLFCPPWTEAVRACVDAEGTHRRPMRTLCELGFLEAASREHCYRLTPEGRGVVRALTRLELLGGQRMKERGR